MEGKETGLLPHRVVIVPSGSFIGDLDDIQACLLWRGESGNSQLFRRLREFAGLRKCKLKPASCRIQTTDSILQKAEGPTRTLGVGSCDVVWILERFGRSRTVLGWLARLKAQSYLAVSSLRMELYCSAANQQHGGWRCPVGSLICAHPVKLSSCG